MEKNELKNRIRNIVHNVYKGPQEIIEDPFEKYGDFSKFPELKAVIFTLLTVDFPNFVNSINWVSPKPTTFCVVLSSQEYFFLIFNDRGWVAQVEGKKYYLMNLDEEKQATEAISRLLYYSPSLGESEEGDADWDKSDKKSKGSGSSSSSSSSSGSDWDESDEASTDKTPEATTDTTDTTDLNEIKNNLRELGLLNEAEGSIDKLNPNVREWANQLSKELDIPLDKFASHSKNRIIIYVDVPRNVIFQKLTKLGYEKTDMTGSSQGGFKNDQGFELLIKPDGKKGIMGDGKENEHTFNEIINSKIKEYGQPINVIFKSKLKKITIKGVKEAKDSSKSEAKSFAKSDTSLSLKDGSTFNISLKQRNAIRWESSKTRNIGGINIFKRFIDLVGKDGKPGKWKNVVLKPIEGFKNKYRLYDPINNKTLSKVIITSTPGEVINDVVFGTEEPKPIVIKDDFIGYNEYSFENGTLTMNCHIIYTDIRDLINTFDEPVFAFSNHIGQAYGIEFRSFSKGLLFDGDKLKGSSTTIDFNDLK